MTHEQQKEHLQQFYDNGASCLCSEYGYDNWVSKGDPPSLGYPHTENSHTLANDANGSNFWTTKDSMDPIWDTHDSKLAEHELGFDEEQMKDGEYYRFDDNNPQEHNLRIASGYEPGANEYFTGKNANGEIDPELYHGKISSGLPEAVSDRTPTNELSKSDTPKTFDLPSEQSNFIKERASEIEKMPEGVDKQQAIADYNQDCAALNNRIDKEQSYINSRIDACDKEMSEWPQGSTEYNRSAENKQWYQDYNKELEQSRPEYISNERDSANSEDSKFGTLPPPKENTHSNISEEKGAIPSSDNQNIDMSKVSHEEYSPTTNDNLSEKGELPSQNVDVGGLDKTNGEADVAENNAHTASSQGDIDQSTFDNNGNQETFQQNNYEVVNDQPERGQTLAQEEGVSMPAQSDEQNIRQDADETNQTSDSFGEKGTQDSSNEQSTAENGEKGTLPSEDTSASEDSANASVERGEYGAEHTQDSGTDDSESINQTTENSDAEQPITSEASESNGPANEATGPSYDSSGLSE